MENFLTFQVTSVQGTRPEKTNVTSKNDEYKNYLHNVDNHLSQLNKSDYKVFLNENFSLVGDSARVLNATGR